MCKVQNFSSWKYSLTQFSEIEVRSNSAGGSGSRVFSGGLQTIVGSTLKWRSENLLFSRKPQSFVTRMLGDNIPFVFHISAHLQLRDLTAPCCRAFKDVCRKWTDWRKMKVLFSEERARYILCIKKCFRCPTFQNSFVMQALVQGAICSLPMNVFWGYRLVQKYSQHPGHYSSCDNELSPDSDLGFPCLPISIRGLQQAPTYIN